MHWVGALDIWVRTHCVRTGIPFGGSCVAEKAGYDIDVVVVSRKHISRGGFAD